MRSPAILFLGGLAALSALPRAAMAQDVAIPILVIEDIETDSREANDQIDLANVVQTAAKGITTVQEAPAIVTIIPGEEITDRGLRELGEALDRVPGWMRLPAQYNQFLILVTRGTPQALLLLHDGVSLFDPQFNIATTTRIVPLENIARIEVVTGPGGVLWGANSFFGVVNLITKDAEDVDGVEASAGLGSANGRLNDFRGYVMAGIPRLFSNKVKLFAHVSFDSFEGASHEMPSMLYTWTRASPNSKAFFGPLDRSDPAQSFALNIDGKLTLGPVNLLWSYPVAERYAGLTFFGAVVKEKHVEDDLPECQPLAGTRQASDHCIDPARTARKHAIHWFDRYAIAEWRTHLGGSRTALQLKAYFVEFVRKFGPIQVLAPIKGLLNGGASFHVNATSYRSGGSLDGDVAITKTARLLFGGEVFREWLPNRATRSRQEPGAETTFDGPYDLSVLPLPCPLAATWNGSEPTTPEKPYVEGCPLTFASQVHRTVVGVFAAAQWRPSNKLIFDLGLRAQAAPELISGRPYDTQFLGSGTIVYELARDWHLKLNFTQGFRPPVFNNTDSNTETLQIPGSKDLVPERSNAAQVEINARLLRGQRGVRELSVRADYAYTVIENNILFDEGVYENHGTSAIHSGEFLGKLYLKGDHRLELGYSFLRSATEDKGQFRALPEHWFHLGAVASLIPKTLEASVGVRVVGALEDPNRRIDVRNLKFDEEGHAAIGNDAQTREVVPTEMVVDRIPPSAHLELSCRYTPRRDFTLSAVVNNALNARTYTPDTFMGFSPRLEMLPNPLEGLRAFASVAARF